MQDQRMVVSLRDPVPPPPPAPAPLPAPAPVPLVQGWPLMKIAYAALAGILVASGAWYGRAWLAGAPKQQAAALASASATSTAAAPQKGGSSDADYVATVGKLIELPQGEDPTVATVTDPSKLQGQAFFKNAKTGDIVLIYTQARKAYLYDPAANMLVDVAPITAAAASTTGS